MTTHLTEQINRASFALKCVFAIGYALTWTAIYWIAR